MDINQDANKSSKVKLLGEQLKTKSGCNQLILYCYNKLKKSIPYKNIYVTKDGEKKRSIFFRYYLLLAIYKLFKKKEKLSSKLFNLFDINIESIHYTINKKNISIICKCRNLHFFFENEFNKRDAILLKYILLHFFVIKSNEKIDYRETIRLYMNNNGDNHIHDIFLYNNMKIEKEDTINIHFFCDGVNEINIDTKDIMHMRIDELYDLT